MCYDIFNETNGYRSYEHTIGNGGDGASIPLGGTAKKKDVANLKKLATSRLINYFLLNYPPFAAAKSFETTLQHSWDPS